MSPHQNPYYPEPPYTLEHCQRCLYGRWHDTGFLRDSNGREYYATTRPSHFKPDAYVFGYYGLMLVEVSCATGPLPPGCPVALELWGANPEIIIEVSRSDHYKLHHGREIYNTKAVNELIDRWRVLALYLQETNLNHHNAETRALAMHEIRKIKDIELPRLLPNLVKITPVMYSAVLSMRG